MNEALLSTLLTACGCSIFLDVHHRNVMVGARVDTRLKKDFENNLSEMVRNKSNKEIANDVDRNTNNQVRNQGGICPPPKISKHCVTILTFFCIVLY